MVYLLLIFSIISIVIIYCYVCHSVYIIRTLAIAVPILLVITFIAKIRLFFTKTA